MASALLTTASRIQCPHRGQAILSTTNQKTSAAAASVLVETDVHTIVGCPFVTGNQYTPCVQIVWSGGAVNVTVFGEKALSRSSVGQCRRADGLVQGTATVVDTQTDAVAV